MEKKGNKENNLTNYLVTELLPSKNNQLLIFSSPALAENAYNELKKFFEKRKIYLLPHSETLPYDFFSSSANVRNERMRTLSRLLSSQKLTLVTSIHSIVSPCPDRLHFLPVNNLKIRNRLDRKELIVSLKLSGYERKELVSEVGEFSVRGSVIDVFTTGLKLPVRIEIYENKVESLRFFNPITQLTTTKLESLSTLPPHEYPLNEKGLNNLKKNWRNIFETYEEDSEIFQNISQGKPADGAEMYLPLFFNQKTTPVEYLYNFKHVFIDPGITKSLNEYELLIKERFEEYRFDIQRPLIHPKNLFLSSEEFYSFLERRKVIKLKVKNLQLNQIDKSQKKEIRNFNISSHTLPKIGELVVHLFHGIGIYKGLRQFSANGIIQDCLEIQYLEESKVYVPVESMHLVSKYFGASNISLDRLGSKKWQKKKIKAIKKTFDIAAELLGIQAKREAKKGLKYEIPKKEYEEFSKEFPYVETEDQYRSILEIKADLKNLKPMDRLVCGEVGFGKTEVAMRASFITAFNNKQTCVLVPTTLLAQQHFETFIKRFKKTPIKVEKISRNVTAKKRRDILEQLAKGNIDILIGTHSILQDSVKFHDLGLLVIDEEHRFGVRQKEKIKKLKEDINLLYLSATPIPRSLNFALSELKDFSIISTAPNERLSVKTFIHSFNQNLIKECIQRELLRGGQVYYLCNDLRLIEGRKERLKELFETFRIEIIHGKLKTKIIEELMIAFQHGKIDILLCSTIIESGLDISNANTLIVEEADRLGLAQLHQLRGRVGRGNKQAYAYFLKSKGITKRKKADSRLDALKASDSLSAGFLLAIKDLEIRGAGEILGSNQSGIMESIGIDLYIKLVNKATAQIKKGILELHFMEKTTDIDLGISMYIPESYLPDINQRLLMYNKISSANSDKELKQIQIEMINRFGLLPLEIKNLFYTAELSIFAIDNNIEKISVSKNNLILKYSNYRKDKIFSKDVDLHKTIDLIKS